MENLVRELFLIEGVFQILVTSYKFHAFSPYSYTTYAVCWILCFKLTHNLYLNLFLRKISNWYRKLETSLTCQKITGKIWTFSSGNKVNRKGEYNSNNNEKRSYCIPTRETLFSWELSELPLFFKGWLEISNVPTSIKKTSLVTC